MKNVQLLRSLKRCVKCNKINQENSNLCIVCKNNKSKEEEAEREKIKRTHEYERKRKIKTCYICGSRMDECKGRCEMCYKKIIVPEFIKNRRLF